ncbi:hypothetical protein CTAM01_10693 [Colletotrichum tamarilloi]|uniref:Uncharacterized protein n=1 Tax=Colletotrichum tamarilloi TaxID=1209934 RepID=A0ABQ9QZP0_9PEZI|nr:uncharacterized protein CTAM01_10693 [Colletotrichum tamarilloi]KAK1490404.1 hypothetical protein CTAM01_10693 [Colletotrichum tamarilloi]
MQRTTQALRHGPLDMGIRCIHRRVGMLSFKGQNIALFQDETYVRSSSTSSSVLSKRCTICQRSSSDVFRTRLRRSISPTRPRGKLRQLLRIYRGREEHFLIYHSLSLTVPAGFYLPPS